MIKACGECSAEECQAIRGDPKGGKFRRMMDIR